MECDCRMKIEVAVSNRVVSDGKEDDNDDDEPDKIPTHHLEFCPLGFVLHTTMMMMMMVEMMMDCRISVSGPMMRVGAQFHCSIHHPLTHPAS